MNVKVDSQSTKEYDKVSVEVNYLKEENKGSETCIDVKASDEKVVNIDAETLSKKAEEKALKAVHANDEKSDTAIDVCIQPSKKATVLNVPFRIGLLLISYGIMFAGVISEYKVNGVLSSQKISEWFPECLLVSVIAFGIIYLTLVALVSISNWKFTPLPLTKVERKPVKYEAGAVKTIDYLIFIATTFAVSEFTKKGVEYISSFNVDKNGFNLGNTSLLIVGFMVSTFFLSFTMMINQIERFLEMISRFIPTYKDASETKKTGEE